MDRFAGSTKTNGDGEKKADGRDAGSSHLGRDRCTQAPCSSAEQRPLMSAPRVVCAIYLYSPPELFL